MSSTVELMAAAIDRAALSAGPLSEPPAGCPLPRTTWQAILRSRRMRVFDWMIDAGFRLLNLLPQANTCFLALAERCELQHKYSVPRNLWLSLRDNIEDDRGWLNAIAETEILLVEVREARSFPNLPEGETDIVALAKGVRLTQLEPETLLLHDLIPQHSIPATAAAVQLAQLRQRFPQRQAVLQNILFVPGWGEEPEGKLIQIDCRVASALMVAVDGGLSVADVGERIGSENLQNLVEIGAIARCDR